MKSISFTLPVLTTSLQPFTALNLNDEMMWLKWAAAMLGRMVEQRVLLWCQQAYLPMAAMPAVGGVAPAAQEIPCFIGH